MKRVEKFLESKVICNYGVSMEIGIVFRNLQRSIYQKASDDDSSFNGTDTIANGATCMEGTGGTLPNDAPSASATAFRR